MLDNGLVSNLETPEAKRSAARDVDSEKQLPPPFEAPARGVVVVSSGPSLVAERHCADCGATLPSAQRRGLRCAECAADSD